MATSVSVSALPSEKSRDLLNNVREELSRTVTRVDEINKNHEYVLNNALYLKVRELLEEMQIGVSRTSPNPKTTINSMVLGPRTYDMADVEPNTGSKYKYTWLPDSCERHRYSIC